MTTQEGHGRQRTFSITKRALPSSRKAPVRNGGEKDKKRGEEEKGGGREWMKTGKRGGSRRTPKEEKVVVSGKFEILKGRKPGELAVAEPSVATKTYS